MVRHKAGMRARASVLDLAATEEAPQSAQIARLLGAGTGRDTLHAAIVPGATKLPPVINPPQYNDGPHYEDGLPTRVAVTATVTDPDSPDFDGGWLTVSVNNATQYDQLDIKPAMTTPPVVRTGNDVFYNGTLVGTVSGGVNGAPLVIQFNAAATPAAVEWVVKSVTYRTTDQLTQDGWKDFTLVVNDGDGGTAQLQTTIAVRGSNDPPVFADFGHGQLLTYTIGTTLSLDPGADAKVTDIDTAFFTSGSLKVSIVDDAVPGEDMLGLAFDNRVTIAPNNWISVDGVQVGILQKAGGAGGGELHIDLWENATPALVAVLLQHLTYTNSSAAPTDATKEIQIVLRDGQGYQVDAGGNVVGTDTSQTTVEIKIGTGILPPPVETQWPAGSILPPMPACPAWDPNILTWNYPVPASGYTVPAGEYRYSVVSLPMFDNPLNGQSVPLTNNGTIWLDGKLEFNLHTPAMLFTVGYSLEVINHGVIAVRHYEQFNVDYGTATAFQSAGNVTNTGEIWAWCENGAARTITSQGVLVTNSGLIAARSENDIAVALTASNVTNLAGGRLLAEGVFAVAVVEFGGGTIENDGLIQARTTHPGTASVGIQMSNGEFVPGVVINRGTITADVAINEVSSGGSPVPRSSEIVRNLATGVINGDIELTLGADQVINAGTINGYIFMGDDDDRVENSGIIVGTIDLGAGVDTFLGGSIAEYVAGMDGADRLEGNAGNDQLMGGGGDDVVIGGVGNDGLFGERGNDRIVTQDGDYAWGGAGDDRIELGDYRFELVSGNEGFDTLVLPAGGRVLDLSLVILEHALEGIEKIVLGGGKEIVVRAADIPALTGGGNTLWLDGLAGDKVDLIGGWVAGASQTVDGVTWRRYDLEGKTVYVTAAPIIQSTPPLNPLGLDPYAGGEPAPIPGAGPLDFTQTYVYRASFAVAGPLAIPYDETWWNDNGPVIVASAGAQIENDGHILSVRDGWWYDVPVVAADLMAGGSLHNTKTVRAIYTFDDGQVPPEFEATSGTVKAIRGGAIVNDGLIEVTAAHGVAAGVELAGALDNRATIDVLSLYGFAIGVDAPGTFANSGVILVQGGLSAIGVRFTGGNGAANAGFIGAAVTSGDSVGISLKMANSASLFTFTNDGEIVADIAIRVEPAGTGVGQRPIAIVNNGVLDGRVELGALNDSIVNRSQITGLVRLNGGDDIFDGTLGSQSGGVHGGDGNDTLIGGSGADLLIGGAGADILEGKSGADIFLYEGVSDSTAAAMDRIRAFQTGIDRIDVRALVNGQIGWTQQTDAADGSTYNLVTIVAAGGNLVLRVDGALSQNDFIEPGHNLVGTASGGDSLTGGSGDDVLNGLGGADVMTGKGGNDIYIVDDFGDQVIEAAGGGGDLVYTSVSYALAAGQEIETLSTRAHGGTDAINLIGNEFAQTLVGNAGNNILNGVGGADVMAGLAGDDTYVVDRVEDQVLEGIGQGNDAVFTSVSYILSSNQEIETLTTQVHAGTENLFLTGNQLNNILIGNAGNNLVNGNAGADTMIGLAGDDTYVIDNAGDLVVDLVNQGSDLVYTYLSHTLTNGNEIETLSTVFQQGTDAINLGGSDYDNTLIGNYGANYINGNGGADTMIGLNGDDTYVADDVGDVVQEAVGGGNDVLFTFASHVLAAGQEVEAISTAAQGATTAINLTGNAFGQIVVGNAGANLIDGKGGSDTLYGLGGADTFAFTTALGAGNVDTLADFVAGTDKIALDDAIFTTIGGTLNAGAFVIGTAAGDADDRIVYNDATGALFYDADGNGGGAAVQFATLSPGLALTAGDFQMI